MYCTVCYVVRPFFKVNCVLAFFCHAIGIASWLHVLFLLNKFEKWSRDPHHPIKYAWCKPGRIFVPCTKAVTIALKNTYYVWNSTYSVQKIMNIYWPPSFPLSSQYHNNVCVWSVSVTLDFNFILSFGNHFILQLTKGS